MQKKGPGCKAFSLVMPCEIGLDPHWHSTPATGMWQPHAVSWSIALEFTKRQANVSVPWPIIFQYLWCRIPRVVPPLHAQTTRKRGNRVETDTMAISYTLDCMPTVYLCNYQLTACFGAILFGELFRLLMGMLTRHFISKRCIALKFTVTKIQTKVWAIFIL